MWKVETVFTYIHSFPHYQQHNHCYNRWPYIDYHFDKRPQFILEFTPGTVDVPTFEICVIPSFTIYTELFHNPINPLCSTH